MAFNINQFKTNGLVLGGVRSSLFEVELTLPIQVGSQAVTNKIMFTCRASSIPASTVGIIEVPYFGRKMENFIVQMVLQLNMQMATKLGLWMANVIIQMDRQ